MAIFEEESNPFDEVCFMLHVLDCSRIQAARHFYDSTIRNSYTTGTQSSEHQEKGLVNVHKLRREEYEIRQL